MVATADERIRTDQLLAGSHFSPFSDHVTTGKLLVRTISANQPVISFFPVYISEGYHLWYFSQVLTGLQEEEYHI